MITLHKRGDAFGSSIVEDFLKSSDLEFGVGGFLGEVQKSFSQTEGNLVLRNWVQDISLGFI